MSEKMTSVLLLTDLGTLQNRVASLLAARLGGQVQGIQLILRDDLLVIQGQVRSYYAKQIVQQVVLDAAPDQQSLINEIEIS